MHIGLHVPNLGTHDRAGFMVGQMVPLAQAVVSYIKEKTLVEIGVRWTSHATLGWLQMTGCWNMSATMGRVAKVWLGLTWMPEGINTFQRMHMQNCDHMVKSGITLFLVGTCCSWVGGNLCFGLCDWRKPWRHSNFFEVSKIS